MRSTRGRDPDQRIERPDQRARVDRARDPRIVPEVSLACGPSPRPRPAAAPRTRPARRPGASPRRSAGGSSRAGQVRRRRPARAPRSGPARAARRRPSGVGASRTSRGQHPLGDGRRGAGSCRRPADVIRPLQNSHSTAFLESVQSHQGPVRRGRSSARSAAVSGPWSATCGEDLLDELRPLALHADHAAPGVVVRALHPPAQERLGRDREQRRLVPPVLEQPARRAVRRRRRAGRADTARAG